MNVVGLSRALEREARFASSAACLSPSSRQAWLPNTRESGVHGTLLRIISEHLYQ
jgi:hypothetical protein